MSNESPTFDPDLWNRMSMALIQAMVGAISTNFRQVSLSQIGDQWRLGFVLEADSSEDREEIADIGTEFEALQEGPLDYEVSVEVSSGDLSFPELPGRVLFRRREGTVTRLADATRAKEQGGDERGSADATRAKEQGGRTVAC